MKGKASISNQNITIKYIHQNAMKSKVDLPSKKGCQIYLLNKEKTSYAREVSI